MEETIDISDLDITVLLRMLWESTITASFFKFNKVLPPEYSEPDKYYRYFDYHCGRPIKTDFTYMRKVYYKGYDRDAGTGTFLKIVEVMRKDMFLNNDET